MPPYGGVGAAPHGAEHPRERQGRAIAEVAVFDLHERLRADMKADRRCVPARRCSSAAAYASADLEYDVDARCHRRLAGCRSSDLTLPANDIAGSSSYLVVDPRGG